MTIIETILAEDNCLPVHYDNLTGRYAACASYRFMVTLEFWAGNRNRKIQFAGDSIEGARAVYRGAAKLSKSRGYCITFNLDVDGECECNRTLYPDGKAL